MADPISVWLQRLKSPDPAVRATSIRELEFLGSTEALPGLAEVFATDPDPELRAMAQAAGKVIYYSAVRRALDRQSNADDERRRAGEILEKARATKISKRVSRG